jgi:S-DNA-T family DNA segregation ATPase FtsK/SpoIIIE
MGLYSYQGNNNIEYIQDEEDFSEFVESIEDICEERQELLKESIANNQVMLPKDFFGRLEPIYIIIDEVDDFIEKGKPFEKTLLELVKKAAECGVIIISTTNAGKLKGYDDLSKWFKSTVNGLLLSNQGTLNIFTVSSMREYPNLGIGLLFNNGVYIRIKLPRCE